jgi:hypothetical protein
MRFLPVIAFLVVFLIVLAKPPEPYVGIPLLTVEVALMILSIKAWLAKPHRK